MFSNILPTCLIVASGLAGVLSQDIFPGRYFISSLAAGIESGHTFVQPSSSNSGNIVVAPFINDDIAFWDITAGSSGAKGAFFLQHSQSGFFAAAQNEVDAPVVAGDATEFEIVLDDGGYHRIRYVGSGFTWTAGQVDDLSEIPITLTNENDMNTMWNFTRIFGQ